MHEKLKFRFQPMLILLLAVASLSLIDSSRGADAKADAFTLSSPAFTNDGTLPKEFTCDGERASPPLEWSNAPAGTKYFAITMHHIPGPGDKHVYLVVYNIPADVHALAKNSKDVGTFGINTVNGNQEYTPPCSKGPGPKKYTMTVYALSAPVKFDQPAPVTMDMLLAAIKNTTLATAEMNVTYSRPAGAGEAPPDQPADGNGPSANAPGGDRVAPRPRGGREQQAIDQLNLTDDQKTKTDAILKDFKEKQDKLRDELLAKLKSVLDDQQYKQVEASLKRPPRQPDQGGGGGGQPSR